MITVLIRDHLHYASKCGRPSSPHKPLYTTLDTPYLCTKTLDFRGFNASSILISRARFASPARSRGAWRMAMAARWPRFVPNRKGIRGGSCPSLHTNVQVVSGCGDAEETRCQGRSENAQVPAHIESRGSYACCRANARFKEWGAECTRWMHQRRLEMFLHIHP